MTVHQLTESELEAQAAAAAAAVILVLIGALFLAGVLSVAVDLWTRRGA